MSLVLETGAPFPGRKSKLVSGSVQIVSFKGRADNRMSVMPALALGARLAVSDGFLRSQSTTMTRLPEFARSWASEAAMVDLPSWGRVEVRPTTLLGVFVGSRSMANLTDRIASANRDVGMAVAAPHVPDPLANIRWPESRAARPAASADFLVALFACR